ncbi:MAG TPA: G5 domain-containing protein [Anaerolineae bacterium]
MNSPLSFKHIAALAVVLVGLGSLLAAGYLAMPVEDPPESERRVEQALRPVGDESSSPLTATEVGGEHVQRLTVTAGSGTAGSGTAGSGTAGSGTAGSGTASSGKSRSPLTVTIEDGTQQKLQHTTAQTVGQALQEAKVTISMADVVEPPLHTRLTPGMVIHVRRGFPLAIHADGRFIQTSSHYTKVHEALAEAGITLAGADYTRPGPEARLRPGDTIQVIRVSEDLRFEDEPIPYQTLWQASPELEIDTRAVVSAGVPGIKRRHIRVRSENGVEVSRTVESESVVREPVNEVIGYGTRIVIRTVDTAEGPLEYWRVVRMRVTSYTAASSGKSPDHPRYGITASGVPVSKGIVAVDRSIVPFRSYVYVPGYGRAFVGDTGGSIHGRWIDLGYDEDNYQSWSGYVDVYYLAPVPPAEDINYLLPDAVP